MEPKNIALLGAGWLGLPLTRYLVDRGHTVRASYRRGAAREAIIDAGGEPFLLDLPDLSSALEAFLLNADALIVTLPPKGRSLGDRATQVYLSALSPLEGMLDSLHVVYTSSTGVYGSRVSGTVDEATPPDPDTDSGRAVVAAEQWLAGQTDRLTVLRLAGLFGPGRDPADFFRQRELIPQGDAPVNMVHLDDVLRAIDLVLTQGLYGTFNVCALTHPTKRAFYSSRFRRADLPEKEFTAGGADAKVVDSTRLRQTGWVPSHDELL